MANEITGNCFVQVTLGNFREKIEVASFVASLTKLNVVSGTLQIANANTAIATTGLTAPGLFYFRNLDATYNIEIGIVDGATFESFLQLLPGQWAAGFLKTAAPVALASNVAGPKLEYKIFDR